MICNYNETATIYKTDPSLYGNKRVVVEAENVPAVFLQNTGFTHSSFRDEIDADAVCYVDPEDSFVSGNYNRLEGMYLVCSPFDAPNTTAWYKIVSVSVNRDHLLSNEIDNVELALKKTTALPGVS